MIDQMTGHKTSLDTFMKIKIISSVFFNQKGLKVETTSRKKNPKHSKSWRQNSMLLNNEWVNNEIKEEIKTFRETNEMSSGKPKNYGMQ